MEPRLTVLTCASKPPGRELLDRDSVRPKPLGSQVPSLDQAAAGAGSTWDWQGPMRFRSQLV